MKTSIVLALAATIATITASPTVAAPIKTLILGDVSFMSDLTPILTDLTGSDNRFDHINSSTYNLSSGLPSASYLGQFNSVLAFTDSVSVDFTALSNLLGSYVQHGGGVVIGTFWGQEGGNSGGLLNSHGFNPLINPTSDAYNANTLGTYDPADPLLANVHSLSANTYDADYDAGLDGGATLAASWSNGRPLAAYNAAHDVAAIALYPNVVTFGHASGDYRPLFANALAFTAGTASPGAVPEPATWALMIGGFGLVGGALRRRASAALTA